MTNETNQASFLSTRRHHIYNIGIVVVDVGVGIIVVRDVQIKLVQIVVIIVDVVIDIHNECENGKDKRYVVERIWSPCFHKYKESQILNKKISKQLIDHISQTESREISNIDN